MYDSIKLCLFVQRSHFQLVILSLFTKYFFIFAYFIVFIIEKNINTILLQICFPSLD